jgi:hypothetical protein
LVVGVESYLVVGVESYLVVGVEVEYNLLLR